jgi:hypothetical protein
MINMVLLLSEIFGNPQVGPPAFALCVAFGAACCRELPVSVNLNNVLVKIKQVNYYERAQPERQQIKPMESP